jgi:serine/threonine protein kinase
MKFLSDDAIERLRKLGEAPDLSGTRYRLLELVARGGMGLVYAARDEKLQRRVALKVLDALDQNGQLEERLIREARILARLEHPGIVSVHDVGTLQDGRVFYTMKFVEGQRLDQHLETVQSTPDRLRLFLRICDAVAFAHSRGVLHRDLKPGNIMIGPFGEVLVMDWGLAKILRESANEQTAEVELETLTTMGSPGSPGPEPSELTPLTGYGTVMGTFGYMSPEQVRGDIDRLDERSDIFSLGAVLRLLLSKEATRNSLFSVNGMYKSLEAICVKATAANPENRYASVTELAGDVSRYLDGLPVSARKESLIDKASRFYRRYSVAILLIAAYLLMRVALLLIWHR